MRRLSMSLIQNEYMSMPKLYKMYKDFYKLYTTKLYTTKLYNTKIISSPLLKSKGGDEHHHGWYLSKWAMVACLEVQGWKALGLVVV